MQSLKVAKLVSDEFAHANVFNHSKEDFSRQSKIFLKLPSGTIYPSIANTLINRCELGISGFLRTKMQFALGDEVIVSEVKVTDFQVSKISLNVSLLGKSKGICCLHEEELRDKIRHKFDSYYLSSGQILLFSMITNGVTYNLLLTVTTKVGGYLAPDATIEICSNDVSFQMMTSSLLKRDLFREDYNFEEIGIGGLNRELVNVFRRALSTRAFPPSVAEKLGISHVKGILLYGAPGGGKTLIARKIGTMISPKEPKVVNGPEIMNKFVGQSEENIRNLFADARHNDGLHVIIFDEIDAICKKRGQGGPASNVSDSIVNQLLSMIDGVHALNNIFIIAMTNRKDLLDEALLRAGRIEVHIEVPLPSREGRAQIFRIHTNKMRNAHMMENIDLLELAEKTDNFSGAEIEAVVKNAASRALHEQLALSRKEISDADILVRRDHFLSSIVEIRPLFGTGVIPLPERLLDIGYASLKQSIRDFITNEKHRSLKRVLLTGKNGIGKTTLVAEIATESKVKYTKFIRAIDMITMDEYGKSTYLAEIISNACMSEESLIVLDDLDILINYAKIGGVSFSNKLYQTLLTILKTEPKRGHRLTVVGICTDEELMITLMGYFDRSYTLNPLKREHVEKLRTLLELEDDGAEGLTIREILNG